MTLHTYTPNQCPYQVSTSYTLRFQRYTADKILYIKVSTARSNQGHTMMLHTYNQCPYQLSISYTLQLLRYIPDKIFKLKDTTACQRSNQGHTMTLHTPTPNQCPYQVSTYYTLRFLRYSLDKLFPAAHLPSHPDTIGENNTPTAIKGCGVKMGNNITISVIRSIQNPQNVVRCKIHRP